MLPQTVMCKSCRPQGKKCCTTAFPGADVDHRRGKHVGSANVRRFDVLTCSYPELECKAVASRLNLCLPTYLQHFRAGGGEVGGTEVDAGGGAEPRLLSA